MKAFCLLVVAVVAVHCADPPPDNPLCVWTNAAQVEYNINGFRNGGTGYTFTYSDHGDTYTIGLALCEALTASPCGPTAGACQTWAGNGKKVLGQNQPTLGALAAEDGGPNGVMVTLGGGETGNAPCRNNNAIIDLVCNPTEAPDTAPVFTYKKVVIANDLCSYEFTTTSNYACPGGGESGGGGGLSGGSLLLIIGFSLFVVYCIAGVAYNKKKNGYEGKELIPNLDFWTGLPGLVKEGGRFTFYTITRRSDYSPL